MQNGRLLFEGKYLRVIQRGSWECVDRNRCTGAVVIVAATESRELILVEQFRQPLQANVIELPAGLMGDIEDETDTMETAARRELLEETGYFASKIEYLCSGPPSPGLSSEIITFVRATSLEKSHPGGGTLEENIIVHHAPLEGIREWLQGQEKNGKVIDPKIYAGLYFLCGG